VFVIDRLLDASGPSTIKSALPDRVSMTRELAEQPSSYGSVSIPADLADRYPYHPLAIRMAFELSTADIDTTPGEFDIFQAPQWGLDRRDDYADDIVEQTHRLIRKTAGFQIDQLVLGYEPGPVAVSDELDSKLLLAWGFFRGYTSDGKQTIKHLAFASVEDLLDVDSGVFRHLVEPIPGEDGPGLLQFKNGRGSTIDSVALRYNDLPWREASYVYDRNVGGDGQNVPAGNRDADFELDYGTIRAERAADVLRIAEQVGLMQALQLPRLRFRAESESVTGATYTVGDFLAPDDAPLEKDQIPTPDGDQTNDLGGKAAYVGLLTERGYSIRSGTHLLKLMLLNFVEAQSLKLRCASAIVIDVDTDGSGNVTDLYVDQASDFGGDQSDGLEFAKGDDIQVVNDIGVEKTSSPAEIATIATGVTTPNTGTANAVEWGLAEPIGAADGVAAGDTVRFAGYDDYENPGHGGRYLTGFGDIHVWLADDAQTLGTDDSEGAFYG